MYRNFHIMVLEENENVDTLIRLAANYNLHCMYKIGIYGSEQQRELFIFGKQWHFRKFCKELNARNEAKLNKEL